MTIKENLKQIRTLVSLYESKYSRTNGAINLVAISKNQSPEKIQQAIDAGQIYFGENYLQEALVKIEKFRTQNLIWHYIGRIQSNKTKLIAKNFSWVETVASFSIAEKLSKFRPITLAPLNICIQVNLDDAENKAGIKREEILPLAKQIITLPNLKLRGLMTIPRIYKEFDDQFKVYHELFYEFTNLKRTITEIDTLSMGMSGDFEAAIAAGATNIRIGTAIFGKRN